MNKLKGMNLNYQITTISFTLILIFSLIGCRNEIINYYPDQLDIDGTRQDYIIQDEIFKIHCYDAYKAQKNKRIYVGLEFDDDINHNIDSLDVNVKFDNNKYLTLTSFHHHIKWYNSESTTQIDIQEFLSGKSKAKEKIPFNTHYKWNGKKSTSYMCYFNGDKSYNPNHLILSIKATISNEDDTIFYNKETKLYPNLEVFYD